MAIKMNKDAFFDWLQESLEEAVVEADADDGAERTVDAWLTRLVPQLREIAAREDASVDAEGGFDEPFGDGFDDGDG